MLRKGEVDYSDLARCEEDADFRAIEELGFWNEGCDVGPLTWEEILLLRQEAGLEDDIAAKIEGEIEFSTLDRLLQDRPILAHPLDASVSWWEFALKHRWLVPTAAAAVLAVMAGIGWLFFSMTSLSEDHAVAGVTAFPPEAEALQKNGQTPALQEDESAADAVAAQSFEEPAPANDMVSATDPVETALGVEELTFDTSTLLPDPASPLLTQTSIPPLDIAAAIPATALEPPTPASIPVATASLVDEQSSVSADTEPTTVVATASPTPAATATPAAKPTPQLSEVTSNFFTIHSIKPINRPPRDNVAVWRVEKSARGRDEVTDFVPCVEVQVSTKDGIAAKDVFARAYFFDRSRNRVASYKEPAKAGPKSNARALHSMPVIFNADSKERLFFEIPPELIGQGWQVVVVFGDKEEAKAITYPHGSSYAMLDFPEKQLVNDRSIRTVRRKRVEDRVIEYVAKTKNPKHPQITLFLRPPKGIQDWSEVQGVYALVVLANSVDDIRRRMQAVELDGDEAGSFAFANKHKLAILIWGSRSIWNARMNFDDYERREAQELDRNFDMVANAWEEAIQHFHKEYGIPTNNFILRGNCGAAQWAKRLCLRKPDYFLAAHIHLAGSYDKLTPEASKVLWCVTTTEQDGGYERSLRFHSAAKEMGYPIIYKAATPQSGIGSLGDHFFEYAMTLKDKRAEYEQKLSRPFQHASTRKEEAPRPWVECFVNPPFYADVVNQEILPADRLEIIPESFRSVIPTKELAEVWGK